jgi:hypothetical protein
VKISEELLERNVSEIKVYQNVSEIPAYRHTIRLEVLITAVLALEGDTFCTYH